jgi:hypothetical protein
MIVSITGHTKGLGSDIFKLISQTHQTVGLSTSNGYDINDTNWYADPASNSKFASLQLQNSNNLTWGGVYGTGIPTIAATSGSGMYFYPTGSTSGYTLEITAAATLTYDMRAQIFYDRDNTAYKFDGTGTSYWGTSQQNGWHYFNQNYGHGIVGLYSAERFQCVYAMGDAYKGNAAGTDLTGAYGLWFSYPNAGGPATSLSSHGLMLVVNGSNWAQLDASTRAVTDMRTPIFRDLNDTSYYCDPNNDSSLYTAKFWGNSITVRGSSPTVYFQDSDQNSAMLHNNSNLFYVLRGGNDSTTWTQVGGYWPVYWDLTNNNATFGGSIWAAGNITAYSDAKLKENIETVDNALEKVLKLRGVYYTLIRDETKTRKLGVIAQEVQEIVPEVVMLHQDKEDEEGTLSVDYGNMVGLLIEAVKEQQAYINTLEAKIQSILEKLEDK